MNLADTLAVIFLTVVTLQDRAFQQSSVLENGSVFFFFFFLSVDFDRLLCFLCVTLVRKYPDLPGSRWEWGLCCDSRGSELIHGCGQRWMVCVLQPFGRLGVHSLGSEQWPCAADLVTPGVSVHLLELFQEFTGWQQCPSPASTQVEARCQQAGRQGPENFPEAWRVWSGPCTSWVGSS